MNRKNLKKVLSFLTVSVLVLFTAPMLGLLSVAFEEEAPPPQITGINGAVDAFTPQLGGEDKISAAKITVTVAYEKAEFDVSDVLVSVGASVTVTMNEDFESSPLVAGTAVPLVQGVSTVFYITVWLPADDFEEPEPEPEITYYYYQLTVVRQVLSEPTPPPVTPPPVTPPPVTLPPFTPPPFTPPPSSEPATPKPKPSPTPVPTYAPRPTLSPTPELTPEPTADATPDSTPELTPSATPTVTPTPTATPDLTPEPPPTIPPVETPPPTPPDNSTEPSSQPTTPNTSVIVFIVVYYSAVLVLGSAAALIIRVKR